MFVMRNISILFLTCLLISCAGMASPPTTPEAASTLSAVPTLEEPRAEIPVIGYFPDYRELNPAWAANLTDIIYFSAEPRADGTLDTSRLSDDTWNALRQLKNEYGLRVHLSIGGWERDGAFASVSADPALREIFVNTVLDFLLAHDLAGVDFDWEFPQTADEFQNYIALLTETKAALESHALLVSVALPAEAGFPLGEFAVVDRVHLMSYDRGERHSTFEQAAADVQTFLDAGIPPEKLILGMPFYGRAVTPPFDEFSYAQLVNDYAPAPDTDEVNGIYFNGPGTIRRKVCYGIQEGLGGFMIWELSQDTSDSSSLLHTIFQLSQGEEAC